MTDFVDKYVTRFNDGLPLDAPGCETCGGSIRAVRERIDGVLIAVIDVVHSDAGCPTLARARYPPLRWSSEAVRPTPLRRKQSADE